MKYNAVLDLSLSEGGIAAGTSYTLATSSETAVDGQSVFTLDGDIDGTTVLLFFIDGVKWEPVEEIGDLTEDKTYFFDGTEITILNGVSVAATPVVASALYVASGSATYQAEPVTVAEVKAWCRIDVSDDDTLLTYLISAARRMCEAYTNTSFVNRTVTARLKNELGGIQLPYGPVMTFTSITDDDDNVIDADTYTIVGSSFKKIKDPFSYDFKAVYTTGYSTLPDNLKVGLLNQIDWMYNNRGSDKSESMAPQAKLILSQFRRIG